MASNEMIALITRMRDFSEKEKDASTNSSDFNFHLGEIIVCNTLLEILAKENDKCI